MSYLRILWRKAAAGLTLLVALFGATAAWANVSNPGQKTANVGTTASGTYVFGYLLFILGIASACWSSAGRPIAATVLGRRTTRSPASPRRQVRSRGKK